MWSFIFEPYWDPTLRLSDRATAGACRGHGYVGQAAPGT